MNQEVFISLFKEKFNSPIFCISRNILPDTHRAEELLCTAINEKINILSSQRHSEQLCIENIH